MKEKLKSLDRNVVAFIIITVLLVVGVAFASSNNTAEDDTSAPAANAQEEQAGEESHEHAEGEADDHNESTEEQEASTETTEAASSESNGQYSYIAQSGDSYTKIARKAVQTYGIVNDVTLSSAQIIFAETVLTQAAGAPLLDVGQELHFAEETLKSTVESAVELSGQAEINWEYYVQFVDFNTDAVGEPQE